MAIAYSEFHFLLVVEQEGCEVDIFSCPYLVPHLRGHRAVQRVHHDGQLVGQPTWNTRDVSALAYICCAVKAVGRVTGVWWLGRVWLAGVSVWRLAWKGVRRRCVLVARWTRLWLVMRGIRVRVSVRVGGRRSCLDRLEDRLTCPVG